MPDTQTPILSRYAPPGPVPQPEPPTAARTFRDAVIGGLVTILGALLLSGITGAWSGKESTADHQADVTRVESKIDRVLDLLCADKPTARQCTSK